MEFWFGFAIGVAGAVTAYEMRTPIVAWIQAREASLYADFQKKVQDALGVAPPAVPVATAPKAA